MWHIITEMCFYTTSSAMDKDSTTVPYRNMSLHMSDYIMYLVGKCGVKSGSNGHFELGKLRRDVRKAISDRSHFSRGRLEQSKVVMYGYEGRGFFTSRASAAAKELRKITDPSDRWEIIATVWAEMLCYLSQNCEAVFHIKSLSTGGEFITHVRILSIILGIPFLREAWLTTAKDDADYSDFVMF